MASSKLFQPLQVGDMILQHRIVMAPLTRFRADAQHVPLPHVIDYYTQRASVPGTLVITEATYIAQRAGGYPNAPGIWTNAQISAWKKIVDSVHAKGSYIFLQLWALGRAATPRQLASEDLNLPYVSASDIPIAGRKDGISPRPLTTSEIQEYIELYATAASNAVHRAGFDGVEVHGANGYLVDQFLQGVSNLRTDAYGGSPEKCSRFALEVVNAVSKRVGESKTAFRMSPWNTYQSMRMKDPVPTFSYLVSKLRENHPNLAYIHVVEPRIDGASTDVIDLAGQSNDFIRKIWGSGDGDDNRRLISAGGYTRDLGMECADKKGDLIAYGRPFISNPDLPYRLLNDIKLAVANRKWYYKYGSLDPKGYSDYPVAGTEEPSSDTVWIESKL
ncbi:NADH:flavin oxidoreductase/NADH oxidase [Collybia nuda]|uniref:NADH:flavin oxidoreductase/NADH oxidase n=1 Tax=Collybia nuda TaxID=64659 RepID=A0A9P6CNP0_9AGAR|nr:NADH:flavin oxidoreductase/NADH oxidase [Collybia nuda]